MNPTPAEEFFSIHLSQEGAHYVQRLYKLIRWAFAMALGFNMLLIVHGFMLYNRTAHVEVQGNFSLFLGARVYPVFMVVMSLMSSIQMFFYFHFTRLCKKAIDTAQPDLFNYSFRWLYRNTVITCFQICMHLLLEGLVLYTDYFNV
jgi:hypothetical protein